MLRAQCPLLAADTYWIMSMQDWADHQGTRKGVFLQRDIQVNSTKTNLSDSAARGN